MSARCERYLDFEIMDCCHDIASIELLTGFERSAEDPNKHVNRA